MNNPSALFSVIAAPLSIPGTNDVAYNSNYTTALNALAFRDNALNEKVNLVQKQADKMNGQIKHLESGFLVVIFILVALLAVVCLKNARKASRPITSERLPLLEDEKAVEPTAVEKK